MLTQSLAGLPSFLFYFATAIGLLLLFVAAYIFITPYQEIALIRAGNAAAAAGLGGAILGFVLPLASTIVLAVPPGGYTVTPPVGSVASARRFRPKARIPVRLHPCRSPSTP